MSKVKNEEQVMEPGIVRQMNTMLKKYLRDAGRKNSYSLSDGGLTFDNPFSDRMLLVLAIREGIPLDHRLFSTR